MTIFQPRPEDSLLDVGISPYSFRGTNFLEQWYPYPWQITALAKEKKEQFKDFQECFPEISLVFGDGRELKFPDNCFDIVFSNAVLEHVGNKLEQKKFVHELCRVGKKILISTPNYWFPLDFHTLIPFAHWLPQRMKAWLYRKLGRGDWADPNRLNLISEKQFTSLFPSGVKLRVYKQSALGITSNLMAFVDKG